MMSQIWGIYALLVVAIACSEHGVAGSDQCARVVASFTTEVSKESDQARLRELSGEMATYVVYHRSCRNSRVIQGLIDLLANSNAIVRTSAAIGLGAMGARAKDAIPALRKALTEADKELRDRIALQPGPAVLPADDEGTEIRRALRNITGHNVAEFKP